MTSFADVVTEVAEALEPFAREERHIAPSEPDDWVIDEPGRISLGDIRRAARALAKLKAASAAYEPSMTDLSDDRMLDEIAEPASCSGRPDISPPAPALENARTLTLSETVAELQAIAAEIDWGPDPIGDLLRERHGPRTAVLRTAVAEVIDPQAFARDAAGNYLSKRFQSREDALAKAATILTMIGERG